jgi:hypothetical protein
MQHRGAQGGKPGERLLLLAEDALLGRRLRREDCPERAELVDQAIGPGGGA